MYKDFEEWMEYVSDFKLPRWKELPDVELYKDQVVTLVERYLSIFNNGEEKIITPASINNYVKWKLLPKPSKRKQYDRIHLSYLIAISALKNILNLQDIKKGIDLKVIEYGETLAYDKFCESFENSLRENIRVIKEKNHIFDFSGNDLSLSLACNALVSKVFAQKYLHFERKK